jgi:hypothetical protein
VHNISMCLYTQQCTADQTSTSEKHVYIKAVFHHCDVMTYYRMHALPQALGPRSVKHDITSGGRFGLIWPSFWMFIIQR